MRGWDKILYIHLVGRDGKFCRCGDRPFSRTDNGAQLPLSGAFAYT